MKFWVFMVRRILLMIPTILGLTFFIFVLLHVGGTNLFLSEYLDPRLPADARARATQELTDRFHLNDPVYVQYFYWLGELLHGNLGYSRTAMGAPVTTAFLWFMPNTLLLAGVASALTWILGVPLGVFSAVRRDSVPDQSLRVVSFTLYSMPVFLIGFGLLLLFGVYWRALPLSGMVSTQLLPSLPDSWYDHAFGVSSPTHILVVDAAIHGYASVAWDAFLHVLLPALTLTLALLAGILRILRASMLEVLDQDYIRLARAKGVPERAVTHLHAKRNALLPAVTSFGYLVAGLLGGAVVVEDIFTFKGVGWWLTNAVLNNDIGAIMGSTFIFGVILVFTSLILDVLYATIDPRIRY